MEMKKAGGIQYLEPKNLATAGVSVQGFTTRHGGVSRPPHNSLNMGMNTSDSPHNIQGNRSLLCRSFGVKVDRFVTVNQVHGVDILAIDTPNPDYSHFLKLECDGILTNQPGLLIGVCIADCIPLLLLDPVKKVAAALHAGWKGTAARMSTKGVEAMAEIFGSRPADILAAIGPSIGSCCYEVDAPVVEAFRKTDPELEGFAPGNVRGTWKLDLGKVNLIQLLNAGLDRNNIFTSPNCVSCEHELFFSYRRDKGETGRQIGFIMLK